MGKTLIEWTRGDDGSLGRTWNPLRGCTKVSAGCAFCYAEAVAARFSGPGQPYEGVVRDGRWTGTVKLVREHLSDPLRWAKPRRVFVNSMSDLFHEDVPDEYIAAVFGVMAAAPRHTFQVLTKRPERMVRWFSGPGRAIDWTEAAASWLDNDGARGALLGSQERAYNARTGGKPLPNVWLGVTVENQHAAEDRIPLLVQAPAAVRFLSVEPLLGPVDLAYAAFNGADSVGTLPGIGWVIVGGESGPHARPCERKWIADVVADCRRADVPVFVKQLGARYSDPVNGVAGASLQVPADLVRVARRLVHRKGGDPAEWPEALRIQEFPHGAR